MNVEQLMTRPVKTCRTADSLNRAAQIMWEGDIGCVPVLDDEDRVAGMITDRDIAMAAYTQGRSLDAIPVEHAMAKHVYICSPDEDVARAVERMQQVQVRRLPVVDSAGSLVGIVSMNDIARAAAHEKGTRKREVRLDSVALTLAKIGRHRGEDLATAPIAPRAEKRRTA